LIQSGGQSGTVIASSSDTYTGTLSPSRDQFLSLHFDQEGLFTYTQYAALNHPLGKPIHMTFDVRVADSDGDSVLTRVTVNVLAATPEPDGAVLLELGCLVWLGRRRMDPQRRVIL
jgi:hypothetical protein